MILDTGSSITSGESTSSSSDDDSGNDGNGGDNDNEEKYNLKHRKHVDIRLSADFNEDIYERVVQLRAERYITPNYISACLHICTYINISYMLYYYYY